MHVAVRALTHRIRAGLPRLVTLKSAEFGVADPIIVPGAPREIWQ